MMDLLASYRRRILHESSTNKKELLTSSDCCDGSAHKLQEKGFT